MKKDSDSDQAESLFKNKSDLDQAKSKNFVFDKSLRFKNILTKRITKHYIEINFILH